MFVISIPNTCLVNSIRILILDITRYYYRSLRGNIRNIPFFGLNGNHITFIIMIQKNKLLFSFISSLFSKKILEKTKNIIKIIKLTTNKNKIKTISIFILMILYLILCHFGIIFQRKQISEFKQVEKLMKNSKNNLKEPLFWLNDHGIVWGVVLGCEKEKIDQGRSYVNKNISISNCFFSRYVTYSESGGVIYVFVCSYSMYLNYSMFYNCTCSSYGGAIYFYSINSCLRMICANRCSCGASDCYHFAWCFASQMNQVEYLSISNCSSSSSGRFSFGINSVNQRIDNTNSSMNNANEGSGISIYSQTSSTSSHCTFSNNKASQCICIDFYSTIGTISMSYSNIVHNNSPSDKGVVNAFGIGSLKMMYCIFHNNQNCLFCVDLNYFEVSSSFIDHSSTIFSQGTAVSTTNNSLTNRITYQMNYYHSHHCNADISLSQISSEKTLSVSFQRTIDQTTRETMARTYDSECEMIVILSYVGINKGEFFMFPIFISYMIVIEFI